MTKAAVKPVKEKTVQFFNAVGDAVVDYCGHKKLIFFSQDRKVVLMLAAEKDKEFLLKWAKDEIKVANTAWENSHAVLKSGKIVTVENPSANDRAIAHIPIVVRDA